MTGLTLFHNEPFDPGPTNKEGLTAVSFTSQFGFNNTGFQVIDEVSVVVPEPAMFGFAAFGTLLMFSRGRR